MSEEASDNKKQIRMEMRQTLRLLSNQQKKIASENIRAQISKLSLTSCAIFAGTSTEPNLLPLLKKHSEVRWFLPRVISKTEMEFVEISENTQLFSGAFGILEPTGPTASLRDISTIFCPGIAFTINGSRLGQGCGFYDRFLGQMLNTQIIGICFDCQILKSLPDEHHDIKMSHLITA